jgi:metallo-beta-lactamase class B
MQLLKNLFQVGGDLHGITFDQPGALWNDANCYALKTDAGIILFDCGCGDTLAQIYSNMEYWGMCPSDISACLLTHAHLDHAGAASQLQKSGVKIIASSLTAEAISSGDERCCGYLYHKKFAPLQADQIIRDEEIFQVGDVMVKSMYVPGHSMGCTAYSFLWENQRILVSGDLIGTLLSGDFGWSGSIDFDKGTYITSLKKMAKVDSDVMLPGHGMAYFHHPKRRVEEVLNAALMQWR